jgi:hypothetical protein
MSPVRKVLTWILGIQDGMVWYGMDWIDLAQDREQWRALVNMGIDIWVP